MYKKLFLALGLIGVVQQSDLRAAAAEDSQNLALRRELFDVFMDFPQQVPDVITLLDESIKAFKDLPSPSRRRGFSLSAYSCKQGCPNRPGGRCVQVNGTAHWRPTGDEPGQCVLIRAPFGGCRLGAAPIRTPAPLHRPCMTAPAPVEGRFR